jgi:hypothetical protein
MGNSVNMYLQVKKIVDDLALVIGGFDPATSGRDTRAALHASTGPTVVLLMTLIGKGVITLADLVAARDAAYADPAWSTVVEQ